MTDNIATVSQNDAASRSDRLARRLESMLEASRNLAGIEDHDRLVESLLELAEQVSDAEASSFLRYDPEEDSLRFHLARGGHGMSDRLRRDVVLRPGEGIAGTTMKERRVLLVADVSRDTRFSCKADSKTGFTTRSILSVPVCYQDRMYGVMQLLNPRSRQGFDHEDARVLESFAGLAGVSLFRADLIRERMEQQLIKAQLDAASRIQSCFRPVIPNLPGGFSVSGHSVSAVEVGGDLYDCIALPDGRWLFYVADVSGKGLAASLVTAALWARLRDIAPHHPSVARLMEAANRGLYQFLSAETYFITMVMCVLDCSTGEAEFCSAGHAPPLFCSGTDVREISEPMHGLPLGIAEDESYVSTVVQLNPGESLVMFSDGVTEAFAPDGEMFGERRMTETVRGCCGGEAARVLAGAVADWHGGRPPSDDVTIFEIWRDNA